jgi:choline kinase
MNARPQMAVILAAGMGTRLRSVFSDKPKGFVEIGDETLIARSLRLLFERGIQRVVIVAGHLGEAYAALAKHDDRIRVVENAAFATTGSMASLAIGIAEVEGDFLVLESDLFFEERALDALLDGGAPNALLVSGQTDATDEVYVDASDGRLLDLSKDRSALTHVVGELVGLLRCSAELGQRLCAAFARFEAREGNGQMAYETDALVEVAADLTVAICLVPDLLWGEVDYEHHYLRVRDEVFPAWRARQAE